MNENGFDVLGALMETGALRIAPADEVFWYTSGTVGPYYINTENLCGGPRKAAEMLDFIESRRGDKDRFPGQLLRRIRTNYATDPIYRSVIDALVQEAGQKAADIDYVSGGERRDWFFSLAVADLLDKPHLTIYKDLSMVVLEDAGSAPAGRSGGKEYSARRRPDYRSIELFQGMDSGPPRVRRTDSLQPQRGGPGTGRLRSSLPGRGANLGPVKGR